MSRKAGYLKESKNISKEESIGNFLQNFGHGGEKFYDEKMVQTGFGAIGNALGSVLIPVPLVGGQIGKAVGGGIADVLSYGHGLIGEIGGVIKGEKNIGDVLSYIPKRIVNDFKDDVINSNFAQVVRGDMNWRDGIMNTLEDWAMIDILAPNKTHAWKDKEGNYHSEYVPGSKMVVGEWIEQKNTQPRPIMDSNEGILGIYNGEVYRRGFDDGRWEQLQRQGKVK